MFLIVATNKNTGKRFECFHWNKSLPYGILRAKEDAKMFGLADVLVDFRAEVVKEMRRIDND